MSKYDDHMIRAATLRKSGNDVKARMHEEHAQYKYGFGARIKRRLNKMLMDFHHPGSEDEDGDCDVYTVELDDGPLATEQKGTIVDVKHGDQKNIRRELFGINTDVWLTIGKLKRGMLPCYLMLNPHEEFSESAFEGSFDQLVVFPAADDKALLLHAYDFGTGLYADLPVVPFVGTHTGELGHIEDVPMDIEVSFRGNEDIASLPFSAHPDDENVERGRETRSTNLKYVRSKDFVITLQGNDFKRDRVYQDMVKEMDDHLKVPELKCKLILRQFLRFARSTQKERAAHLLPRTKPSLRSRVQSLIYGRPKKKSNQAGQFTDPIAAYLSYLDGSSKTGENIQRMLNAQQNHHATAAHEYDVRFHIWPSSETSASVSSGKTLTGWEDVLTKPFGFRIVRTDRDLDGQTSVLGEVQVRVVPNEFAFGGA